jgi:hypothetical protein
MTATATATATPPLPWPYVYAMRMYTQRLQILVSKEQRRRLEREAKRRGASVASVIREAVDERLGGIAREDRIAAADWIAAIEPQPYVAPDDLKRLIAEAHDAETRFPPEGAPE